MSGSVIHSQSAAMVPQCILPVQSPQLPVVIDYPAAWHFARCRWFMMNCRNICWLRSECPAPLRPGSAPQDAVGHLWNTGARINEALALTRGDFSSRLRIRLCSLRPWNNGPKKRQDGGENARRSADSPAGSALDSWYVSQLQTMVATLKIPMDGVTVAQEGQRKRGSGKWRTDGQDLDWGGGCRRCCWRCDVSVPVTPHTFRHSYAMHMLYAVYRWKFCKAWWDISPSVQRSLHEGFCAGCGCPAPGAVCDLKQLSWE